MLYQLLKLPAKLGFWLYCRHLKVNNKVAFNLQGPMIIACNHPNSFLDAIVISALFKQPVHSLARGDAFKNPLISKILRSMHMLPVYRTSEGVENMEHNYSTFEACKEIFKKNGIVLIFSEGRCTNEWHLRPLKKGTARLALSSWAEGIEVKILPAGLNYNRFRSYDKNIHCFFGEIFGSGDVIRNEGFGKSIQSFNSLLQQSLQSLVYEIEESNLDSRRTIFKVAVPIWKRAMLLIPAAFACCLHFPLYMPAKVIANKFGAHNDHYDSILISLLFLLYPLYLLLMIAIAYVFTANMASLVLIFFLPFCAWSYLQIKNQF